MKFKNILLTIFIIFFAFACKWDIPKGPFYNLKNDEVLSPMDYFSNGFKDIDIIVFEATFPEDVSNEIASYHWDVKNIFGETVLESSEATFSTEYGMLPDEYVVILTIYNSDESFKRSFKKSFIVIETEKTNELKVLGFTDPENQDTGDSQNDRITKVNTGLKFSCEGPASKKVSLSVKCTYPSYEKNFPENPETIDDEGKAIITINETLADGIYQCQLIGKDSQGKDISSFPIFFTVDTTAPNLSWKNAGENLSFEYGTTDVIAYAIIKDENGDPGYVEFTATNFPQADLEKYKGFNPYMLGTQNISVTSTDVAGNVGNTITRGLTITKPLDSDLPVIKNGGFEASVGASARDSKESHFKSSDETNGIPYAENVGIANDWNIDAATALKVKNTTWTGEEEFTGEGPFRVDREQNKRSWYKYFVIAVRNDIKRTGDNSFWFSGWIQSPAVSWKYPHCYYNQFWGTIKQDSISIKEKVPYKLSTWVLIKSDKDKYIPDVIGKLAIKNGDSVGFSTDGDFEIDSTGEVVIDINKFDKDVWTEVSLNFIPMKDCDISIEFTKSKKEGNPLSTWGCDVFIDDITITYGTFSEVN